MSPVLLRPGKFKGSVFLAAVSLALLLAACSIVEYGNPVADPPSLQLEVGPPPPPPTHITVANEDGVKLVDQKVPRSGLITANPAPGQMTGELTVIVRTAGRGESTTVIEVGENERLEIDVDRETATVTDVRKAPVTSAGSSGNSGDSNVGGD